MKLIGSESYIPHGLFLKAITQFYDATSVNDLFLEDTDLIEYKSALIYHIPVFGTQNKEPKGRYWAKGMSQPILEYIDSQKNLNEPVRNYVMKQGRPFWMSQLKDDSHQFDEDINKRVNLALNGLGDGILIPLFGPYEKRAYSYISFKNPKEFYDEIFMWQMQGLLQAMHVKYCIIREALQTNIELTPRESDVLELITFGKTNPEIGQVLGISSNTVTGYVKQIFLKLGVSDRVSAAMQARNFHIGQE